MKFEDRKFNEQLREKFLSLDGKDLRIRFFRPDEGMRVYHVGRDVILNLAEEANAMYKIGRSCVIDKELFEKNLEKYRVTSERKKK